MNQADYQDPYNADDESDLTYVVNDLQKIEIENLEHQLSTYKIKLTNEKTRNSLLRQHCKLLEFALVYNFSFMSVLKEIELKCLFEDMMNEEKGKEEKEQEEKEQEQEKVNGQKSRENRESSGESLLDPLLKHLENIKIKNENLKFYRVFWIDVR